MSETTTVHADRNSGILHFEMSEKFATYALCVLLAANLIATVVLYEAYQADRQEQDLKRYDLDFFKQNDWQHLQTQVDVNTRMIQLQGKCPR